MSKDWVKPLNESILLDLYIIQCLSEQFEVLMMNNYLWQMAVEGILAISQLKSL